MAKEKVFDNKAYQNEYHKRMKTKLISFNPAKKEDMVLWDHLQTKENQTGYIKKLIREDMMEEDKPMENNIWYAVLMDREDNDWGTGSFDLEEAKEKARLMGATIIAVIDNSTSNPVCIEEITDF